jgi:hypothetical protein
VHWRFCAHWHMGPKIAVHYQRWFDIGRSHIERSMRLIPLFLRVRDLGMGAFRRVCVMLMPYQ